MEFSLIQVDHRWIQISASGVLSGLVLPDEDRFYFRLRWKAGARSMIRMDKQAMHAIRVQEAKKVRCYIQ